MIVVQASVIGSRGGVSTLLTSVGRSFLQPHCSIRTSSAYIVGNGLIPGIHVNESDQYNRPGTLCKSANSDGDNAPTETQASGDENKDEDEPIWVRREREREMAKQGNKELPFGVYLLLSSIVAIAAVGSIFEYTNKNPIFDVIYPDSPFYAPILGLFSFTGIPTAGFLFIKAVGAANAEAERMDKLDGVESKDNYFNRRE